MTYKTIPGPKVISIPNNGDYSAATESFATIINAQAAAGWKYHSMETVTVQQKVGCSLQPQYQNTNIYMLIFYQD